MEIGTVNFINKSSSTKLIEHKDEFSSYDAFDDNYIVAIKQQKSELDGPMVLVG